MGWAEKRIREYQQGQEATWLERRTIEHANPVHASLAWISLVPLIYGLWTHNWYAIGAGIALNIIGHIYCWVQK
jgi:hypothetical protein